MFKVIVWMFLIGCAYSCIVIGLMVVIIATVADFLPKLGINRPKSGGYFQSRPDKNGP